MVAPSAFKDLLRTKLTIGSWITLAHPAIAEIMAKAGFDWLVVDLEHSVITIREAEELIRIIDFCGVVPLVRLSANDPVQIKRVMDAGAHGVIVPMVNSSEDAERAVAAVKYPPLGRRGVGLARAQGYGARFEEYKSWLEQESIVIVQVEHIKAVENLGDILSTEGVDGFIVGPYDLSASLGVSGQFEHPAMFDALREVRRVGGSRKEVAGYHVVPPQPDLVIQKVQEGYRFLAYSVDMLFLGEMCRNGLQEIRDHK
jgi:2-dehydro-3-deoxyglucarate aldolase